MACWKQEKQIWSSADTCCGWFFLLSHYVIIIVLLASQNNNKQTSLALSFTLHLPHTHTHTHKTGIPISYFMPIRYLVKFHARPLKSSRAVTNWLISGLALRTHGNYMPFLHGGNWSTGCTTAFQRWLTSCGEQHVSQQLLKMKEEKKGKNTLPARDSVSRGSLLNYAATVLAEKFVSLRASFTAAAAEAQARAGIKC